MQCLQWAAPFPSVKIAPSHGDLDPSNTCFRGPTRVHTPYDISIGSAVFAGLTTVTDGTTDRPRYTVYSPPYVRIFSAMRNHNNSNQPNIIMVALWNRADNYIFILFLSFFFLLFLFPRLISAVGDWMSTILPHMVWP